MHYIKELREREGASISEIARRLNVSWVTARKYADGYIAATEQPKRTRGTRLIEPYLEYVQAWIEEDCRRHRKQCRTTRLIFEHLKALGFGPVVQSCVMSSRQVNLGN